MVEARRPTSDRGPFTVRTETFVDRSRSTTTGTAHRSLPTDLYLPDGPGPFPLVVHAHGWNGSSAKFSKLLSAWAGAGYVVVAPNFPCTNGDLPEDLRDLGDYVNQPADLTFVLDTVLSMNTPGGVVEGIVDPDRIGLSGLSLGGATAYPLLFNDAYRDDRYRSGLLMSALELPFDDHRYDHSRRLPVLTFAGTADDSVPYEIQQDTIAELAGPRWDVTLLGGEHSAPYEDTPSPQDELVVSGTIAFWDLTLREDAAAQQRLVDAVAVEGLAFVDTTP